MLLVTYGALVFFFIQCLLGTCVGTKLEILVFFVCKTGFIVLALTFPLRVRKSKYDLAVFPHVYGVLYPVKICSHPMPFHSSLLLHFSFQSFTHPSHSHTHIPET